MMRSVSMRDGRARLVAAAFVALTSGTTVPAAQQTEEGAVRAVVSRFHTAVTSGDAPGAMAAVGADAVFLEAGGVIQLARPGISLGDFFAVWGQPLDLGFAGELRVFVNGAEHHGEPARIPLRDRDQVVLEVGGYVPPHRSFAFPPEVTA